MPQLNHSQHYLLQHRLMFSTSQHHQHKNLGIAHELQVSKASISSDMQHLRKQAKESIKE
jgi:biotin operon repressor